MKSAYASMYNISSDSTWSVTTSAYSIFPWNHLGETNGVVTANPTTGQFTITEPGIYLVMVSIGMSLAEVNDAVNMMIFKNGIANPSIQINPNVDSSDGDWATGTATGIVRCAAGDVLDFRGQSYNFNDTFNMQASSITIVFLSCC